VLGDTRAGSEVTAPDPAPRGLFLSGLFGSRAPRAVGALRTLFVAVWLIYVVQPVASVFKHQYGVLYIAGAVAITVVYCGVFLCVVGAPHVRRTVSLWRIVPLFALAALACVVYDGAKWNALWIYVSAACGLALADRRVAVRAVVAAGACFLLFSWIGHDNESDLLITLLPVLLVGFAMIGFRMQIELTRQLRAARETVAQLAASEERLRLARDMHDLTGQSLSMITLKSELAGRLLTRLPASQERDRVRDEIEQVAAVSRQTLHDIREAISGYRRPTLAVEIITARTALEAAGVTPHNDACLTLLSGTFDAEAEAALAWCLREAVTNVIRHSGARNCHISLTRRPCSLSVTVRDDGRGCAGPSTNGTGLHGMTERLTAVGGDVEIAPRTSGGGFNLTATVPVKTSTTVIS
jgi:two-component system, NarL family, sensor histidine kinase DesK